MFEKLIQFRDALRTGAGRLADVVGKGKDALGELEQLLRGVEAGEVFALTAEQDAELAALRADFEEIGRDREHVGAAAAADPQAIPPALAALLAQLAAELIGAWLRKRRGQQP